MLKRLEQNAELHEVILCLDNDKAGQAATERLTGILKQRGYEDVVVLVPEGKDWNEMLCTEREQAQTVTMTMG
jgi:DNA primase